MTSEFVPPEYREGGSEYTPPPTATPDHEVKRLQAIAEELERRLINANQLLDDSRVRIGGLVVEGDALRRDLNSREIDCNKYKETLKIIANAYGHIPAEELQRIAILAVY